jgi:hypothetical protein
MLATQAWHDRPGTTTIRRCCDPDGGCGTNTIYLKVCQASINPQARRMTIEPEEVAFRWLDEGSRSCLILLVDIWVWLKMDLASPESAEDHHWRANRDLISLLKHPMATLQAPSLVASRPRTTQPNPLVMHLATCHHTHTYTHPFILSLLVAPNTYSIIQPLEV